MILNLLLLLKTEIRVLEFKMEPGVSNISNAELQTPRGFFSIDDRSTFIYSSKYPVSC